MLVVQAYGAARRQVLLQKIKYPYVSQRNMQAIRKKERREVKMQIIEPSVRIMGKYSEREMCQNIERAGRTCYQSLDKATNDSCFDFVRMLIKREHESVLEHESITVEFVCDRGVSHELIRHRLASYSQESTRFCAYKDGLIFIRPCFFAEDSIEYKSWYDIMARIEKLYKTMLKNGVGPQQARSILPNSLKTTIVMTANIREWRYILGLRCSRAAHPQMRQVMFMLLELFNKDFPTLFGDVYNNIYYQTGGKING